MDSEKEKVSAADESGVTMVDVLQEEQELEEESNVSINKKVFAWVSIQKKTVLLVWDILLLKNR